MSIGHFEFYRGTWSFVFPFFFHWWKSVTLLAHSSRPCQFVGFFFIFFCPFMRNVWNTTHCQGVNKKSQISVLSVALAKLQTRPSKSSLTFFFVFSLTIVVKVLRKSIHARNYLFTLIPTPLFLDELIFVMIDV